MKNKHVWINIGQCNGKEMDVENGDQCFLTKKKADEYGYALKVNTGITSKSVKFVRAK